MRAWTGETWGPSDPTATIVLQHPGALRSALLARSDLTAGEAYVFDDIDIEGDILAALEFVASLGDLRSDHLGALRLLRLIRQLPADNKRSRQTRPPRKGRLHSKERDSISISTHYDTGNDFFQLFLDPMMVYSCAAFLNPEEPLEMAQRRKLDLICRKLELRPGQRMLDIGCGWGALAIHAARNYDVEVLGVTLSASQADIANASTQEAGLTDRVKIRVLDYRDVTGSFDAISSVGMFEHVGKSQLERYFDHVHGLLNADGSFLNHGIVTRDKARFKSTPTFINTYVFPDGELERLDEVIQQLNQSGFDLRDSESLRVPYALTLRRWVAKLDANRDAAVAVANEQTYRIWRLYMAASALGFETSGLSVHQLLLHKPGRRWTFGRSHLIAADDSDTERLP